MNDSALMVQGPVYMPVMRMEEAAQRYQALVQFVRGLMKEGVDYGVIPGTDKPTLLKPGAERLTTYFGLTPRFTLVNYVEDWDGVAHSGEPFFYYLYRCQLYRGDYLIAEADGLCNSRESRYRWRWVGEEDLPQGVNKATLKARGGRTSEFEFAVDKAETTGRYGKPAAYWQQFKSAIENGTAAKVTRRLKNGEERAAWEIDTTVYRVPNEDIASQVNTMQKISQKRALVAVTLLAVNASEFFTQDLEDLDIIDVHYTVVSSPAPATPVESQAGAAAAGQAATQPKAGDGNGNGQPKQRPAKEPGAVTRFWSRVKELGVNNEDAKAMVAEFGGDFDAALTVLEKPVREPLSTGGTKTGPIDVKAVVDRLNGLMSAKPEGWRAAAPSEKARGLLAAKLSDIFDRNDEQRHELLAALTGVGSVNGISKAWCMALIDYMMVGGDGDNRYSLVEGVKDEIWAVWLDWHESQPATDGGAELAPL